jgi:hypothetical protein
LHFLAGYGIIYTVKGTEHSHTGGGRLVRMGGV